MNKKIVQMICALLLFWTATTLPVTLSVQNGTVQEVVVHLKLFDKKSTLLTLAPGQTQKFDAGANGLRRIKWSFPAPSASKKEFCSGTWYMVATNLPDRNIGYLSRNFEERLVEILNKESKSVYIGAAGLQEPLGTLVGQEANPPKSLCGRKADK
jgi:hypothetical protein